MLTNILLQAGAQPGGGMGSLFIMLAMIVVMYFFMIRPQQKRAKEQKAFAESLVAGEKVVTSSGIHGKILRANDDGTLLLEIDRNTNIVIERQAVSMEMTKAFQKRAGVADAPKVVA
ncbi:MAG TPA: preprotein translocase subunit YajC [Edaphocola sp.]|nr:preprotein translocase subunit YajC [Edaphocola sp.]